MCQLSVRKILRFFSLQFCAGALSSKFSLTLSSPTFPSSFLYRLQHSFLVYMHYVFDCNFNFLAFHSEPLCLRFLEKTPCCLSIESHLKQFFVKNGASSTHPIILHTTTFWNFKHTHEKKNCFNLVLFHTRLLFLMNCWWIVKNVFLSFLSFPAECLLWKCQIADTRKRRREKCVVWNG